MARTAARPRRCAWGRSVTVSVVVFVVVVVAQPRGRGLFPAGRPALILPGVSSIGQLGTGHLDSPSTSGHQPQ